MKRINLLHLASVTILMSVNIFTACNTSVNVKESKTGTSSGAAKPEQVTSIPDSVIQYLTASAAKDFNEHRPPTATDFRNVKAGYISSGNEKVYLMCGEFLSGEKKEWESFTTIKTSGYEQYIGGDGYCEKAIFVNTDSKWLSSQIKNKLTELKK